MTTDDRPAIPNDPAYAAAIGLVSAPLGRRALAFTVDALLVAIVTLPLTLGALPALSGAGLRISAGADPTALLASGALAWPLIWYAVGQGALIVLLLVQLLLHGLRGVTVGKALTGIRSVSARDFGRPGFWRVALRALVLWAATGVVPLLGAVPFLLSPLWDPRGRGWLDRIGGTWFVDVRTGLDPYDAKALRIARKRVDSPPPEPEAPLPSLATAASGSFANFLPATRSSSGVVSAAPDAAPAAAWTPPAVGGVGAAARDTPVAAASAPPTLAVLVFDDGVRVAVDGPLVLGRNPAPSTVEARTLVVADPTKQISKTHAEVGVDAAGAWIRDLHSANGTEVVVGPNGPDRVDAGTRHPVPWGATVEIGGRRFRIDRPSGGSA